MEANFKKFGDIKRLANDSDQEGNPQYDYLIEAARQNQLRLPKCLTKEPSEDDLPLEFIFGKE